MGVTSCFNQGGRSQGSPNQTSGNGTPSPLITSPPLIALLDGYTDKQSYTPGDDITLFLNTLTTGQSRIRLLDVLGKEAFSIPVQSYPQKTTNAQPWLDGFGYTPTATFKVPNIASGLYFWEGKIRCIIKPAISASPRVLIVYPTSTENAYNLIGGKCFYVPNPGYPNTLSFLRPSDNNNYIKFNAGFYQWMLTQTQYDCGHIADSDLENFANISSGKVIILTGHSEYWTRTARLNFDQFINQGGHSLILSGNTMWWQARYSPDGNQLICYKYATDPIPDPNLATILWRNTNYPTLFSIGADFAYGGYGNNPNGWNGMKIVASQSPIFAGTSLRNGDILSFKSFEYDGTPITGYDLNGSPIINYGQLRFARVNLIGYNFGTSLTGTQSVATWFAFQRTATSGFVINGSSTDWCSKNTIEGVDGANIKKIITNSIDTLLLNVYPV